MLSDCEVIIFVTMLGRACELGYLLTRLRAGRFGVRIPAGVTDFYLLQIVQTACGAHPASISMGTTVLLGVKQPERDVDHAPPSSTEVKNEWSFMSAPCLCVLRYEQGKIYLLKQNALFESM